MVPDIRSLIRHAVAWLMLRTFGVTPQSIIKDRIELRYLRTERDRLRLELARSREDLRWEQNNAPTARMFPAAKQVGEIGRDTDTGEPVFLLEVLK